MELQFNMSPGAGCDRAISFQKAGQPVRFEDAALERARQEAFAGDGLTLGTDEMRTLRMKVCGAFTDVLLISAPESSDDAAFAARCAKAGAQLAAAKAETVFIDAPAAGHMPEGSERLFAYSLMQGAYRFDAHRTQKEGGAPAVLRFMQKDTPEVREGALVGRCACIARDLVNESASIMTPSALADAAKALGDEYGFETEILGRAECEKLGMGLFLSVAAGSAEEPEFIVMRWKGGSGAPTAFVGKGLTYDSGGLAIKKSGMELMRFDMNGAGAVIGAMCAIAASRLKLNVTAAVPACENAVDAHSYRNGDTLTSMNGKSVYVGNTDAEGRLAMADAITYCVRREHPAELIEIAGLTGSVASFFGAKYAATLSRDGAFGAELARAGAHYCEKYAPLPYDESFRELLKCPYADISNVSATSGGITAGMFLDSFSEGTRFLHVDLGGTPFTSNPPAGQQAGATGFGVASLYAYAKEKASLR